MTEADLKVGNKMYFLNGDTGLIFLGEVIYSRIHQNYYGARSMASVNISVMGNNGRKSTKYLYLYSNENGEFQSTALFANLEEVRKRQQQVKKALAARYNAALDACTKKIRRTKEKITRLKNVSNEPVWTPTVKKLV